MKAGDYLVSKVVESSEIKNNEAYYETMRSLYDHIVHGWYDSYCEASAGQEGAKQYSSFEEFLLGSQGLDEEGYKNFLDTSAEKDVKKYLVIQAIAEKIGVNVSEEDINA